MATVVAVAAKAYVDVGVGVEPGAGGGGTLDAERAALVEVGHQQIGDGERTPDEQPAFAVAEEVSGRDRTRDEEPDVVALVVEVQRTVDGEVTVDQIHQAVLAVTLVVTVSDGDGAA